MVSTLVSISFGSSRLGFTIKANFVTFHTVYPRYDFYESLGLTSPPYFVCVFSRKTFLILYYINWPNFIFWLPLLLEISGNMSIVIFCYTIFDVINFEIFLSLLIKSFSYMIEYSVKKLKYFKKEKSFKGEIKSIFHHFS